MIEAAEDVSTEERKFSEQVETLFEEKVEDFSKTLNVAVIGRVSSGKSSLINALLRRTRETALLEVGARSGTTTQVRVLRIDERVRLIDSPGLEDVRAHVSKTTEDLLEDVDVGILVITGSADASQKRHLDDLRATCHKVFVVLNKVDAWDKLASSAQQGVIDQWKAALGVEVIYPVCAFGYDPETQPDAPLDIRGVDKLRQDLEAFLESEGKLLLLARHMGDKTTYAVGIIVAALLAVGVEAFIPGSAVYITATQAAAICSLYYLYTGKVLSTKAALAVLPTFAARAIGMTLFLWVKSFLPPTGILDAAAAFVAVSITLAMLATVSSVLARGHELRERELLQEQFTKFRARAKEMLRDSTRSDWGQADFWSRILRELVS